MKILKIEFSIAVVQGLIYLISILFNLPFMSFILGFIFGVWLIARGSEVAVDGLRGI